MTRLAVSESGIHLPQPAGAAYSHPMLLERDRELAVLTKALARARTGSGAGVSISGESGAGKSALVEAATSGNPKFFLGTDSAPHAKDLKEAACGCAGVYTAHAGIELYAAAFEEAGALDKLEGFASRFGPAFYGLPVNADTITLVREEWAVPETLGFGKGRLVPLRAGETISWKLA